MNTFASFKSFSAWAGSGRVQIGETPNTKSHLVFIDGEVAATIHGELKGSTAAETLSNLRSVNLSVGIPHEGSKDRNGRASLPCVIENRSEIELLDL